MDFPEIVALGYQIRRTGHISPGCNSLIWFHSDKQISAQISTLSSQFPARTVVTEETRPFLQVKDGVPDFSTCLLLGVKCTVNVKVCNLCCADSHT